MTPPRVQFVIGGVQKGGTTALARYMAQHPDVRLPHGKEAHVFDAPSFDESWDVARVDAAYAPHFAGQPPGGVHGDATPIYMLHPLLVERIARYNPQMRWILLLRDPAERAISHFNMERRRSLEHWPLLPALLLERFRLSGHGDDFSDRSPLRTYSYRLRGDYVRQLDAIHAHFPAAQVKLLRSDRLRRAPQSCLEEVFDFLGLPRPRSPIDVAPVFEGGYQAPGPLLSGFVRWLFRRERRELARRYGIRF